MPAVNTLIYSIMLSQLHNLKRVIWIGIHIDAPEYMQMCEKAFKALSKDEDSFLIFPRYHSFLGSLGLLLSQGSLSEKRKDSHNLDSDIYEDDKDTDLYNVGNLIGRPDTLRQH